MKILIVEDDHLVAKHIKMTLKQSAFTSDHVLTGEEAIEYINTYDYDLIILDLILPDIQGYEVLKYLRHTKNLATPVLILSGLSESMEKIRGLNDGADDYLTKPFNAAELVARINAITRRHQGHSSSNITVGKLVIEIDKRQVKFDGKPISLTGSEYSILHILALRSGKVISKEVLLNKLYDGLSEPEPKIIDVFICKLRDKINHVAEGEPGKRYIATIWGQGYMLKNPEESLDDSESTTTAR